VLTHGCSFITSSRSIAVVADEKSYFTHSNVSRRQLTTLCALGAGHEADKFQAFDTVPHAKKKPYIEKNRVGDEGRSNTNR
jgi:hypothetical protein